jgi:pimeloyl-ACP methyl ester carboxylesterase
MRRLLVSLLFFGAAPLAGQGQLITDSVRSPALEGNRLGDSPVRPLLVYLPPSYAQDVTRRYPALYLLHGFGGSPQSWVDGKYQGLAIGRAMDSLIALQAVKEFIIVMPDGANALHGSVWTNSATTGDWETYLVRDVVRYVDQHYRTIRRGPSRGVAGHSMGAGAALRLAMRYPAGFSAVYAMSPNAGLPCEQLTAADRETLLHLTRRTQADSIGGWSQVCLGYAAAWSPDSARPPFYADLPFHEVDAAVVPDSAVIEQWRGWRLLDMAPRYREGLVRLRGIAFDVGTSDGYASGVAQFDSLLTHLRVRHRYQTYDGDHSDRIGRRVIESLLPWFSGALNFEPEGM